MRMMSFAATTRQMRERTKTVTRRTGWRGLEPGTLLWAVDRLPYRAGKGGHQVLGVIRVTDVRREPLETITPEELAREGLPDMAPADFMRMFCLLNGCAPGIEVTRIEFEHVKLEAA